MEKFSYTNKKGIITIIENETGKTSSISINEGRAYGVRGKPLKVYNKLLREGMWYLRYENKAKNEIDHGLIAFCQQNEVGIAYLPLLEKFLKIGKKVSIYELPKWKKYEEKIPNLFSVLVKCSLEKIHISDFDLFTFENSFPSIGDLPSGVKRELSNIFKETDYNIKYMNYIIGRVFSRKIHYFFDWDGMAIEVYKWRKEMKKNNKLSNDFFYQYTSLKDEYEDFLNKELNNLIFEKMKNFKTWETDTFIIAPLKTTEDLKKESKEMKNCVGGYGRRIAYEDCSLFSYRNKIDKNDMATFQLNLNKHGYFVYAIYGYDNEMCSTLARNSAEEYVKRINPS